ncbi:MAG TPA: hypothetical protein VE177_08180, partial [Candidatus Binatus sp.]|nr:hypothetical protein [Candidatus Binatus sp.]
SLLAIIFVTHAFNLVLVALLGFAGIGLLGLKMGEVFRIPGMKRDESTTRQPPSHPATPSSGDLTHSPTTSPE